MGTKACVPVGTHPVGTHCILELYGCSPGLLNDLEFVQRSLRDAAKVCESTLIGEVLHQFHPQGVTALALLAESHISIHTLARTGVRGDRYFHLWGSDPTGKGMPVFDWGFSVHFPSSPDPIASSHE
jgi:S-adenosylmethionine decarboxylase proenzyme